MSSVGRRGDNAFSARDGAGENCLLCLLVIFFWFVCLFVCLFVFEANLRVEVMDPAGVAPALVTDMKIWLMGTSEPMSRPGESE